MFVKMLTNARIRSIARKLGITKLAAYVVSIPLRKQAQRDIELYRKLQPSVFSDTFDGQAFQLVVENEADYLRCGLYRTDRHLIDRLFSQVQAGDVFWDIGANYGLYSICASIKVGNQGEVYCFDPVKWCCERVQKNAALNHVSNIKTMELAISERTSTFSMEQMDSPVSGVSRLEEVKETRAAVLHPVQAKAGDELVSSGLARTPNVIKIDVEGHEIKVLQGLEKVLASNACRAVMVEVHFTLLEKNGVADPVNVISSIFEKAGLKQLSWLDASHILAVRP